MCMCVCVLHPSLFFLPPEQSKPTVFSIAQKRNSRLRVKGWRVGRINDQLESMVRHNDGPRERRGRGKEDTPTSVLDSIPHMYWINNLNTIPRQCSVSLVELACEH